MAVWLSEHQVCCAAVFQFGGASLNHATFVCLPNFHSQLFRFGWSSAVESSDKLRRSRLSLIDRLFPQSDQENKVS